MNKRRPVPTGGLYFENCYLFIGPIFIIQLTEVKRVVNLLDLPLSNRLKRL